MGTVLKKRILSDVEEVTGVTQCSRLLEHARLSNLWNLVLSDVEEVTRRTGSFRRFSVFARMLRAAVAESSETVFVDLLSYADLCALKARQGTDSLSYSEK